MDSTSGAAKPKYGSLPGLLGILAIGFALYFFLKYIPTMEILPSYTRIVSNLDNPGHHVLWFLINFTDADFYAGPISSVFLLAGSALAWFLSLRKSRYAGIEICYGSARIWPWLLASQILSLVLTQYAFGYLELFHEGMTWVPTFIVLVSVPPSMLLLYGPGLKNLITVSILGAAICTPAAVWIGTATKAWGIPGPVNNVFSMVVAGILAGCVCHVLPWMDRVEIKPTGNRNAPKENCYSATWLMRRTVADLAEPLFYGNEIGSIFLLAGVIIEWILNPALLTGGAMMLPAIILSQFISGGLGVFLYAGKYEEKGWYATYVPVVCTAPACILVFGPGRPHRRTPG